MTLKSISQIIIRGEPALQFPIQRTFTKILDANGGMVVDIRGWGRLQYHPDGEEAAEKLQDAIGDWIVETLNAKAKEEGVY